MRLRVRTGLGVLIGGLALAACSSSVRITKESDARGLEKPLMVYVYDFAVEQSEVKVDPGGPLQRLREGGGLLGGGGGGGLLRGGESQGEPAAQNEQMLALGHQLADQVALDLVKRITAMGLPAQRITREQLPPEGAIAVVWKRARPALGHGLARDSAWITWRYLDDPSRRYRVLQAMRGAEVVGYMVCGVAEPTAVTIPEIFTVPGDAATFESLVAFAVRQYAAVGADSLRTLAIPDSWTHVQLRRLGFIGMRHQFPVEYIPLEPSESGSEGDLAAGWHLAGGDFDVV